MNIKKSFEKAKEIRGYKSSYEVAGKMGVSPQSLHNTVNSKNPKAETFERFAKFFKMKPSKFIALGED